MSSLPVTAWITSSTLAGSASRTPNHVHAGELCTASRTRPRIAMPKRLNSARPTLPVMNGYSSTPPSWATSRTAEGSRRANLTTAAR